MVDLHVHSTSSDGSFTPSELVDYAIKKNLTAFALTDHDTCSGIDEAIRYAASINSDLTVIPGIELSTKYENKPVHILGLNIDYKNHEFLEKIRPFVEARYNRNAQMLDLFKENNIPITEDILVRRFGKDTVITRAHYAILMIESGMVKDKDEAFEKYLGCGCKFYIERKHMTPFEAVDFIKIAGGHPVMAHPVLYDFDDATLDKLVCDLQKCGLEGIEAMYSCNRNGDTEKYTALANRYGLYITGGSDFHGTAKPGLELGTGYGNLCVPDELLEKVLAY